MVATHQTRYPWAANSTEYYFQAGHINKRASAALCHCKGRQSFNRAFVTPLLTNPHRSNNLPERGKRRFVNMWEARQLTEPAEVGYWIKSLVNKCNMVVEWVAGEAGSENGR